MPILVKDFTWTQTAKTVHIRIPQRDVSRDKVDLFTTDCYIKVHFKPFLFEVFLLHDVDNERSTCIIKDDLITLDLCKRDDIEWECLEKDLTKPEKMNLRKEIHDKCQEEAKQTFEDKKVKQSNLDRFTVHQAMEIDSTQHELMDSRKNAETKKAMDALEEWRMNPNKGKINLNRDIEFKEKRSGVTITELPDDDPKDEDKGAKIIELTSGDESKKKEPLLMQPPTNPIKKQSKKPVRKPVKTPVRSEFVDKMKEEVAKRVLPKLRETAVLEITHTPRTLPTPSRESKVDEENAWLKNITLARRATGN